MLTITVSDETPALNMQGVTDLAFAEFETRMESMSVEKHSPEWEAYFQEFAVIERSDDSVQTGVHVGPSVSSMQYKKT